METFDSTVASIDNRLADGARTTEYDLILLKHAWNIANKEWGWALDSNPMEKIQLPENQSSQRTSIDAGEFDRLRKAASECPAGICNQLLNWQSKQPCGKENYFLPWCNIDFEKSVALLLETKNGNIWWVPFTERALEIISSLEQTSEVVFPVGPDALRHGWDRLCRRAEIKGLRFMT